MTDILNYATLLKKNSPSEYLNKTGGILIFIISINFTEKIIK